MSTNSGCLQTQCIYKQWMSTHSGCLQTVDVYKQWVSTNTVCLQRVVVYKQWMSTNTVYLQTVDVYKQWMSTNSGCLQTVDVYKHSGCLQACLSICSRGEVLTLHAGPYCQYLTPGTIAQLEPQKWKVRILLKCFGN